jgi:hypothetical protein
LEVFMRHRLLPRLSLITVCALAAAEPASAVRTEVALFGTTVQSNDNFAEWTVGSGGNQWTARDFFPPNGLPLHLVFTMDSPVFPTPAGVRDPAKLTTLSLGAFDLSNWLAQAQPPGHFPFFGGTAPAINLGTSFTDGLGFVQDVRYSELDRRLFGYLARSESTSGTLNGQPASGVTQVGFGWQVAGDTPPAVPPWFVAVNTTPWTGTWAASASLFETAAPPEHRQYFTRSFQGAFRVDRTVVRTDAAAIRSSGPVSPCVADPAAAGCLLPVGLLGTTFAVASAMTVGAIAGDRGRLFIEGGAQMTAPQITVDRGGLLAVTGGLDAASQLTLATALRVRDGEVQIVGGGKLRVDGAPPPPPGGSFQSFASVGLGYGGGSALVEVFGSGSELVVSQAGASLAVGTINSADVAGSGVLRTDQFGLVRTPILEVGFNGGLGTVDVLGGSWVDVYNPVAAPVGARLFVGRGGGLGEVFVDGRAADGTRSLLSVRGPSSQAIIGGYNPAASNFAGGGTGSLVVRNGGVARINNLLLVGSGPTGGLPAGKAVPQGELQVLSGGKVEVLGYAEPATNRPALYAGVWGGNGKIVVDGADSTLSVLGADPVVAIDAGQLDAGTAGLGGTGRLEVRNGGRLQVGDAGVGRLIIGARGELIVDNAAVRIASNGRFGVTHIYGTAQLTNGFSFVSEESFVHDGGALRMDGDIEGALTIEDGGTLHVNGQINGDLIIQKGGQMFIGSSPGQLVVNGSLDWTEGLIELEVEADGNGGFRTDRLVMVGAEAGDIVLTGAQLRFVFLGDTDPRQFAASALNTPGTFFQLQTDAGPVGLDALVPWSTLFAGSTVSASAEGYTITAFDYDIETGFTAMQAVPVPEPSMLVLSVLGVLAVAARVSRHGRLAARPV